MVSRWAIAVALALVGAPGCNQLFGIHDLGADGGGGGGGGGGDGSAAICFGSTPELVFCVATVANQITLSQAIDTSSSELCAVVATGPVAACVIAANQLSIQSEVAVEVTGGRPLVLAGANLQITGTLDVSSSTGRTGPDADPTACDDGTPPGDAAGGEGGSFGANGGDGGGGTGGGAGGAHGPPPNISFHGGCPGTLGTGTLQGDGGHGGGAVLLIGTTEIDVQGTIDASGGHGLGSTNQIDTGGGGGGGAGGFIGLDAPVIDFNSGTIFANGGGGGGGADPSSPGIDGNDSSGPGLPGAGGPGGGKGGAGGDGGWLMVPDGRAGVTGLEGGGGGGGGSVGVVQMTVVPAPAPSNISPAPVQLK
nr:hypothetical protein [Kofleriaceae bacterium]